jgi:hypothetical protein
VVSEKRCSLGETLPKEPKSHAHTSYSLATSWAVSFSPVVLVEKEVAAARALEEAWDRVGKELRARHFFEGLGLGPFFDFGGNGFAIVVANNTGAEGLCIRRFSSMHVKGNDDEMRIFVFMQWGGFGDGVAGKEKMLELYIAKCRKMPEAR